VRQLHLLVGARPATFQPPLEGHLALGCCSSGEKTLDAEVLIEVWPVNTLATADESAAPAFPRRPVKQARVPGERCRDRSPVTQLNDDGVVDDPRADR